MVEYTTIGQAALKIEGADEEPAEQSMFPATNDDAEVNKDIDYNNLDADHDDVEVDYHTRFLCQNQVLIVCMTQDQLFHTYGPKVLTDNQMSRIKYNYYISNVSKDYDDS
jgi:hypothetical protein